MRSPIRKGLPAASLFLLAVMPGWSAHGETLEDAFIAAYTTSPIIEARRAQLRSVDENVPQALSGWRPQVEANTSYGLAHSSGRGGTINTSPLQGQLSISQPLYTGGRVESRRDRAEYQVLQGRYSLTGTEQDVLLATVTSYMDVLRDQEVVLLNENNVVVLRRQLKASQDRFDVGEATRTDVAQAEARVQRALSDLSASQGQLQISRAAYRRAVGHLPDMLAAPPPLPPLPVTVDEAIVIGVKNNPAMWSSQYGESIAIADINVAKSQLYPTISLDANVSVSDESTGSTARTDSATIFGRVNIPLYQGGQVYSQVRQAEQVRSQRRIETLDVRRQVEQSVTSAWAFLTSSRASIQSGDAQVRANLIALEGVRQELLVGARTTLDVLDAEQELLNAQVALVRTRRDEYVAGFQLLSAIGGLTAENLNLPVERYDPKAHYGKVRNQWFGFKPGG